jgi:hypothetical protein
VQQTCSLFDHLVGTGDQHRRHLKAERLGGFEVEHQLELDRHLNGKLARLLAAQDAVRIDGGAPIIIDDGLCIPTDLRRLSAVVLA